MNVWTRKSIELANQRNYLDLLYKIYPMSMNLKRELSNIEIENIRYNFINRNSKELLNILLRQEIFPIKDSYVSYLRRDNKSIDRNPNTVERITGMLYEIGLEEIYNKITLPKETNRQIGPLFKNWILTGSIGCYITSSKLEFLDYKGNIIFNSTDEIMKDFAIQEFGYKRNKGIDFIAKFNETIIIAEAKFLTDFGGHQNAQFDDAINTMLLPLNKSRYKVKVISILDGVLYIKSNNKMYKRITEEFSDNEVIISAVLLRDYLYTI